jgi:hypothetical protein
MALARGGAQLGWRISMKEKASGEQDMATKKEG